MARDDTTSTEGRTTTDMPLTGAGTVSTEGEDRAGDRGTRRGRGRGSTATSGGADEDRSQVDLDSPRTVDLTDGREHHPTPEREPLVMRVGRGAIAGVVAGLVFLVLNMWYASSVGGSETQPLHLISTLLLGPEALGDGSNALLGLVIHVGLSALFGIAFSFLAPLMRNNGAIAAGGALFGLALYIINFGIIAQTTLTQFQAPNDPVELMAHLIYGLILGMAFYSTGVRRGLRRFPVGRGDGLRHERS